VEELVIGLSGRRHPSFHVTVRGLQLRGWSSDFFVYSTLFIDRPAFFFFSSHWFFNFHFPLRTPLANKVNVLIARCLYERWGGGVERWKTTKSLSTSTNSVCQDQQNRLCFNHRLNRFTFTKTMSFCLKAKFRPTKCLHF